MPFSYIKPNLTDDSPETRDLFGPKYTTQDLLGYLAAFMSDICSQAVICL